MLNTIVGTGAAGLLLLFLEMFLPGLIAGIAGGVLLFVSVILAYSHYGAEGGNIALVIATACSATMWWWWANHFQNTRFGKKMTLNTSVDGHTVTPGLRDLVGQLGIATTTLRPGGTITVEGRRVDAIADCGEFIESGTSIRVIRAQGICVIVSKA